jgi:hypothetical protein
MNKRIRLASTYLHLGFQLVLQNPAKLLYIMLHECIRTLPSETLGQLGRSYRLVRALEVVEDSLKSEGQGFGRCIVLGRDLVDSSSEIGSAKERLKERVHVASSSLVLETDESSLLFRIVARDGSRE